MNVVKPEVIPKERITFLGEDLDIRAARAFISQERRDAIVEITAKAEKQKGLLISQAERLLGLLVSAFPTVPQGRTHLRKLQRAVIVVIRTGRNMPKQAKCYNNFNGGEILDTYRSEDYSR